MAQGMVGWGENSPLTSSEPSMGPRSIAGPRAFKNSPYISGILQARQARVQKGLKMLPGQLIVEMGMKEMLKHRYNPAN